MQVTEVQGRVLKARGKVGSIPTKEDGERLLPERTLAKSLNISVGTLRKALKDLEQKGALFRKHGSGNYVKFNTMFREYPITLNIVYDPEFMSVYNLDDDTKKFLIDDIKNSSLSNTKSATDIIKTINQPTNGKLKKELQYFLSQFTERRKINADFMPESFKYWLEA